MSDISVPMDWQPGDAVTCYYADYIGIVIEILRFGENAGLGELALVYWPNKGIDSINSIVLQPAF